MLRGLDRSIASDLDIAGSTEPAVNWVIESIRSASPVAMSLRPDVLLEDAAVGDYGDLVIDTATHGLNLINAPQELDEVPEYFTPHVLEEVYSLARLPQADLRSISVKSERESVLFTEWVSTNTARFIRTSLEVYGTVEGTLQMVSVAGNPHIHVRDRVTGRPVHCSVSGERMDRVIQAFGRRVEVFGRMQINERGDVLRIKLEEIRLLPDRDELLPVEEIIRPVDLTEGRSIREFLADLRNAG